MYGIKNKYVPQITLPTQEKIKMLEELKKGFRRSIYWNEHRTEISEEAQNHYLKILIDSSFQGFNRLFALTFENGNYWITHRGYFLPRVEIKNTM